MDQSTQIGVLVAGVLCSFKVIEILVARMTNREKSVLTEEEAGLLKDLYNMHNIRDSGGTPVWYVPKSIGEIQKEIMEKLQNISINQAKTSLVLDLLVKKLKS